jgi:hypothetical protein
MAEQNHIEKALNEPRSATGDGVSAQQHSLRERIEAEEYLAQKKARKGRKLPIRLAKIRPGGAI